MIKAFITAHNFCIIWLSETFWDSKIPLNDENINIKGYWLLRGDYPNNIKPKGVCVYLKESFPLIRQRDHGNMKEYLVTEINVNNKKSPFYMPV